MIIGSRGSPLALTQARQVAAMLAAQAGDADASTFPIESFMTSGDRLQGRLQEQGGKGLFTKELDEALLDGRIDCAVHSMKDLPTRLPEGIVLACVPAREDPRDGFIATRAKTLAALPEGALSPRSNLIMVYAMCGFANLGSVGMMIASLTALVPERRDEVVELSLKSLISGTLASGMTGAVIGLLPAAWI